MVKFVINILEKFMSREALRYIFFGGLTTLISVIVYHISIFAGLGVFAANTISTIIAISFAFCVNKVWVFNSKDLSGKTTGKELFKFVSGRAVTYAIETSLLMFLVYFLDLNPIICKYFTQGLIIVLNYVISKYFVFKG